MSVETQTWVKRSLKLNLSVAARKHSWPCLMQIRSCTATPIGKEKKKGKRKERRKMAYRSDKATLGIETCSFLFFFWGGGGREGLYRDEIALSREIKSISRASSCSFRGLFKRKNVRRFYLRTSVLRSRSMDCNELDKVHWFASEPLRWETFRRFRILETQRITYILACSISLIGMLQALRAKSGLFI